MGGRDGFVRKIRPTESLRYATMWIDLQLGPKCNEDAAEHLACRIKHDKKG